MGLLNVRRLSQRGAPLYMLLASIVAACDSGPAALVREIEAARAGCTEEMLKASDEVCIRMFERYADMAADGMETYIGGMRAFDEAIQRRGGLQFDTTGLGNPFGVRRGAGADSGGVGAPGIVDRPTIGRIGGADGAVPDPGGMISPPAYSVEPGGYSDGAYQPVVGGLWSDPLPGEVPAVAAEPYEPAPSGSPPPLASPASPRRGVLLPPEERLRRPWIDGVGSADPYVEEASPRRDVQPVPRQQEPGWDGEPYPDQRGGTWATY